MWMPWRHAQILPLWHAHIFHCGMRTSSPVACAQISTGEEGFLNQKGGATWMEDGSEGGDYAANLADPNIAFGTAHCCEPPLPPMLLQLPCPDAPAALQKVGWLPWPLRWLLPEVAHACMRADPSNFGIPASSASAFLAAFISSRAAVAQALGKPFILEETGMDVRAFLCGIISLSCSALPRTS